MRVAIIWRRFVRQPQLLQVREVWLRGATLGNRPKGCLTHIYNSHCNKTRGIFTESECGELLEAPMKGVFYCNDYQQHESSIL